MVPFFKNGDYDSGVLQAAAVITKLIAAEYNVSISESDSIKIEEPSKKFSIFDFLFLVLVIIMLISRSFFWFLPIFGSRRGRSGYWSSGGFGGGSGGFGGGFGGFGGGFSGGGGASGHW